MRILTLLAAAFLSCQPAIAQTPAQKPTTPTKPVVTKPVTPKPSATSAPATPASGQMELLCRNFGVPRAQSSSSSILSYEKITLNDATGTPRTFYAPVRARISFGFTPATSLVTGRGETLADGSCGLRTSVIGPVSGYPLLSLVIDEPPALTLSGSGRTGDAAFSSTSATVNLPPCPSGLRRFTAIRTSANEFFVDLYTPSRTGCID
jgi:hypothetical protein